MLQIAAAVSFISLGGISLVVARSFFEAAGAGVAADSARRATTDSVRAPLTAMRPAISFAGGISDLATEDLEKLLGTIESLEAAPPVDPEASSPSTTGRVGSDTSGE
jgi:hypothetical protein